MEPICDHERLEVYQTARAFTREIRPLLEEVPRGNANSKDNLKRAATSVTRNIADGGGRWKIPEKIREDFVLPDRARVGYRMRRHPR